jgi:hypothetical protein
VECSSYLLTHETLLLLLLLLALLLLALLLLVTAKVPQGMSYATLAGVPSV